MKKYFVINGRGGSGKDTFIDILSNELPEWNIINISSIDPIKDILYFTGWDGKKDNKSRKVLSDLKKIFINYNDLPTKFLINKLTYMPDNTIIFMHIREPSEIEKIWNLNTSIKTIIIDRNINKLGNSSDDFVYDYQYDYIINNNGSLLEFENSIKTFIKHAI